MAFRDMNKCLPCAQTGVMNFALVKTPQGLPFEGWTCSPLDESTLNTPLDGLQQKSQGSVSRPSISRKMMGGQGSSSYLPGHWPSLPGQATTGQAPKWCEKWADMQGRIERRTRRKSQRSRHWHETDLGSYQLRNLVGFTQALWSVDVIFKVGRIPQLIHSKSQEIMTHKNNTECTNVIK